MHCRPLLSVAGVAIPDRSAVTIVLPWHASAVVLQQAISCSNWVLPVLQPGQTVPLVPGGRAAGTNSRMFGLPMVGVVFTILNLIVSPTTPGVLPLYRPGQRI